MHLTPEKPIAGILAPLFAIRSENDLGIGDTESLRQLVDWAYDNGFRLVQLLPINETGNDNSPYNAISSVAIDPTTIAITPEEISDLQPTDYNGVLAGVDRDKLQAGPVNYPLVKALKRQLLERAFNHFSETSWKSNSQRARKFREWLKEQEHWIEGYSLFRLLMDENGKTEMWDTWPEDRRTLVDAKKWLESQKQDRRRELDRKIRFFQYVQWLAFTQWQKLKAYCDSKNVALMGDVPIGVSYYSSDVFSNPEIFNLKWSGGAPPERVFKSDPFTEKWGQNWGVPIYRWDAVAKQDFTWWKTRVSMVRGIFHLFRIDHVLGFYRMYGFPWRPNRNDEFLPFTEEEAKARTGGELPHFIPRDDSTWENREANRLDGETYLRALQEEVGEFRLIGEDLGVVPEYVRPSLSSLGIAGFKIPQWERGHEGRYIRGQDYQRLSIVTYATHDHLPIRAWWDAMCLSAQNGDLHQKWELEKLGEFAGLRIYNPQPLTSEIHEALLFALFRSNAWIAITMITDLFGSSQRFNVPGAVADSNWSERLHHSVSEWRKDAVLQAKMDRIKVVLKTTGRC